MAGTPAEEAGEVAACPRCGAEVKQKSMIPVLGEGGPAAPPAYLCRECARALIPTDDGEVAAADGSAA